MKPPLPPADGETLLRQWSAESKKQHAQFRKQIHEQLQSCRATTDTAHASCGCQQCVRVPAALPPSNIVPDEDGTTYVWGDPFPIRTTPCGWRLQGRAFTLRDPTPCTNRLGLPRQLGWYLQTGTTQTLRLPDGTYRTYFASAGLNQVTKDQQLITTWPVYDSNTISNHAHMKFSMRPDEPRAYDIESDLELYWKANLSNCMDCHFSKNFVGFLDSVDGINYPFYTPKLLPASGTNCENVSYQGSEPIFEEPGFRAGWRSTCVPASNATLVYRDVSVVYVPDCALYLMVAVQCDGRGLGYGQNPPDLIEGADIYVTDSAGNTLLDTNNQPRRTRCQLCTPHEGTQNQAPKTRLVFFLCDSADFQVNVRGPFEFQFPALDRSSYVDANNVPQIGEWLGVPQAFMDEERRFIFLFQHANLKAGSTYPNGLLVASVGSVASLLTSLYTEDPDPQESNNLAYTAALTAALTQYPSPSRQTATDRSVTGNVQIECADTVAGWAEGAAQTPSYVTVDEHFVFYKNRLHIFFTRKHSDYSYPNPFNTQQQITPLSAVSQAVALSSYSADALQNIIDNTFPQEIYYDTVTYADPLNQYLIHRHTRYLLRARAAEQRFLDRLPEMLLTYRASSCDPILMPEELGVTDPTQSFVEPTSPQYTSTPPLGIEVNDPNVYVAEDGTLVMLVHCGALGGIIILTAPPGTGGDLPAPC